MPAQEDIAAGLHESLAGDHPLTGIGELTASRIRFQHGFLGLLGLQEQRVTVVATRQEHHPGTSADTADADHLQCHVHVLELGQQMAAVRLQRAAVAPQNRTHLVLDDVGRYAPLLGKVVERNDQRGALMMRRRPSTSSVNFSMACMESRVRALSRFFWALGRSFCALDLLNRANSCVRSKCAYQTSRLRIVANWRVVSR